MKPNTGDARRDTARRHQERSQWAFRCAAALIERDRKARSHPGYESEQTPRSHARMLDLFPPGVLRARPNQGHLMMNSATLIRTFALSAACAAVHAPLAFAADADSSSQARYRSEMAVCESGRSNQDAATCRIESHNALAAARQGVLTDPPGQYGGNAQQRCTALEGVEYSACEARMRGEGSIEGSVSDGGILRENATVLPEK